MGSGCVVPFKLNEDGRIQDLGHGLQPRGDLAVGPAPLIVCEHGAFGCASDWAVVQEKLAVRGLRSLAYDRAGLGRSDPGPSPRDGVAVASDFEAMLVNQGSGELAVTVRFIDEQGRQYGIEPQQLLQLLQLQREKARTPARPRSRCRRRPAPGRPIWPRSASRAPACRTPCRQSCAPKSPAS